MEQLLKHIMLMLPSCIQSTICTPFLVIHLTYFVSLEHYLSTQYIALVIVIVMVEIAAGIVGFVFRDEVVSVHDIVLMHVYM